VTTTPQVEPGTELYVYYRAPRALRESVRSSLAQAFAGPMQQCPGLQSRLLRRGDAQVSTSPSAEASDTWMEIHVRTGGLSGTDLELLQTTLADLPAGRIGPRHAEVFVADNGGQGFDAPPNTVAEQRRSR
jgi:hypothetical protein